jgi:hypothetical protein
MLMNASVTGHMALISCQSHKMDIQCSQMRAVRSIYPINGCLSSLAALKVQQGCGPLFQQMATCKKVRQVSNPNFLAGFARVRFFAVLVI